MNSATLGLLEHLHMKLALLELAAEGLRVPAAQRDALLEEMGALRDAVGAHLALHGVAA
jgi:hypothetical protein